MQKIELLAKASGVRIYEIDSALVVKKDPAAWVGTTRFVFFLLTAIPLMAGISQLIMAFRGIAPTLIPGFILLGISSVFAFVLWLIVNYTRKINELKLEELETLCIFDLSRSQLLDAQGNRLDDLVNVSVWREFQLTSSSKKLLVKWSNGERTLAKGNPFSGGTLPLESIFRRYNLMK